MRKTIIITVYVILGLLLFKFAFTYGYNEWVISKYEEEDYSENFALLEVMNVNEPYIVYYNNGNVMYQRMDYEAAVDYYVQALEHNPPEGKECAIRINLALTKLEFLGDDFMMPQNIDKSIELLEECLDILSEDDCANDEGTGHNNRAQRLYNEIKDLLEELKKEKEQQETEPSDSSDSSDSSNQSDSNQSQSGQGESSQDPSESQSQSESIEQRQSEIEDEMERKMSSANDQRQQERKENQENAEDWNWYYDDHPVW
ncbi:MAG: tetratricopeptide repeat protein [Clostridiales bacterium]|nr:tetratricopeptide repeat protein [Clostridiales bacterium]